MAQDTAYQSGDKRAYYVYAIVRPQGGGKPGPLSVEGILPGVPISTVSHRDLLAVVSPVPLAEFDPPALEAHLQDPDWAQGRVLAHQRVLTALLDGYTLVPLKFCTLYHNQARVQEMLTRYYKALVEAMRRLERAAEWGIKIYCDRRLLIEWVQEKSEVLQSQREKAAQASTGAGYFLRKKLERAAQEEAQEFVDACMCDSHQSLAQCAREAVTNPIQPPQVHGRRTDMVLNAAYLVDTGDQETFRTTLATLEMAYAPQGIQYELTGPWPPYNFAALELEELADEPVAMG